jgi:hypothetical protein
MKKLILFISLLFLGMGLMAQSTQTTVFAAQTLTNGDSAYMTSPVINGLWTYSFQAVFVELTGAATAGGLLQFSNDNVSWTTSPTHDTLTATDDGSIWLTGAMQGKYVRFELIQTGTATGTVAGTLVLKK